MSALSTNNQPLKTKHLPSRSLLNSLSYILILTGSIALLMSFGTFLIYDQISFKNNMSRQVNAIAQVAASNSQGALSFDDTDAARQVLESLQNYSQIRYALIMRKSGQPFSEYNNNWDQAVTPRVIENNMFIDENFIEVSQPIIWDDEVIGQIYLLSDVEQLKIRQLEFTLVAFIVFAISFLSSITITRRRINTALVPIANLVKLVKEIGKNKNYTLRAESSEINELNTLVDGFNGMLSEMEVSEAALLKSEERLSLALLGGGEGLWDIDLTMQQLYLDQHSCKILALKQNEALLSNAQWYQMIHPDDVERFRMHAQDYTENPVEQYNIEFRVACEDSWLWLRLSGKITEFDHDERPMRMTGTLQDITKEHLAEEQIKLYASVFDNTSDAIVILNEQFRVIAVNQAFSNITQFGAKEMHHEQLSVTCNLDILPEIKFQLKTTGSWCGELNDRRKDGSSYILELALNAVKHTNQEAYNYIVAVFSDITERKKNENELFILANFDPLTKLANRAMFHDHLANSLANAHSTGKMLALLFIDLDKFKQVNDTLGHDAGDELLVQSAKRMQSHIRDTDFLSRLSGDEFTIILDNITDLRQAESIARKIQQDFQREFLLNNQRAHIGTSIGISVYPNDALTGDALLKQADTAMYHAKSGGRNNFHFFDNAMNVQAERRNLIERELHFALARNQISVYYQPKVDANSFKILGFEALARWFHPELGPISPVEFISVAEDAGLIKDLGQYIFATACLQLKSWHKAGFNQLQVAINVSAREFQLSDYPLEIAKIIKDLDVNPKYIELELTETIVMDNPEKNTLMLDVIKSLGVTLSIDDFGTGYSSLCYLRKLPVDILKVDQSFVRELEHDNSAAIASAIVSMAHSLKLKVVAEGVETIEQLEFFQQQNCEIIQGYYFSPPVSGEQSMKLLSSDWHPKFTQQADHIQCEDLK